MAYMRAAHGAFILITQTKAPKPSSCVGQPQHAQQHHQHQQLLLLANNNNNNNCS